jgi:hypothetical protein
MKRETIQRVASPTAILVSLEDPLATQVQEILADGGLKVLKVGHVAGACERLPVVMPQLVIAPSDLAGTELEELEDRCVAVGAELMKLAPGADASATTRLLKDAANQALIRALRGNR